MVLPYLLITASRPPRIYRISRDLAELRNHTGGRPIAYVCVSSEPLLFLALSISAKSGNLWRNT
jgi:hypothetical protein